METLYKKHTIKIVQDDCFESPRDWDNLGTMIFFHKRYNLGDKHNYSVEEAQELELNKNYICLPVYMYDHSGITISTSPFGCSWDSGKLGIIAVSLDKVRKKYGVKRVSQKLYNKICSYLEGEVKTYDQFLNGEVYGYQIEDSEGNELDSCYGFYREDEALKEAQSIVDYYDQQTPKQLEFDFRQA